jgi:dipeptidyl aminopeptidase/acylaminoacyl peptidase
LSERRVRRALLSAVPPDEIGAQRRAWRVTRAAFVDREPTPWPVLHRRRIGALAIALAFLAAAITPPGRAVLGGVRDAVGTERVVVAGVPRARPAPFTLPTKGRILVSAPSGVWIVGGDGARRKVGNYDEATWSPRFLHVPAARGHQLTALTPRGVVRWTLSQPKVHSPDWSPSGFRVAYLSGRELRVVAGDGTDDTRLDAAVDVAPVWKPGDEHVLAYVAAAGMVNVVNTDTQQTLWTSGGTTARPQRLGWSADGTRLLSAPRYSRGFGLTVFDDGGTRRQFLAFAGELLDFEFAPRGHRVAVIRQVGERSELMIVNADSLRRREVIFSGKGRFSDVSWSPDGRWLLVGWPSADQWLFLRSTDVSKLKAVSSLAVQFDPGGLGAGEFPRIEGWCCRAE